MDQVEEKEENRFQEPTTDRCKEDKEQNNSEESSVDQRKEEEEEKEEEKERSKEATRPAAAPSFFTHPCSLLQYVARVCTCCLGLSDSFCDPKPRALPVPEPAAADPSQEGEEEGKMSSYFYMQEVTTGLRAERIRPRPPGNPREGSGGNGGHHH